MQNSLKMFVFLGSNRGLFIGRLIAENVSTVKLVILFFMEHVLIMVATFYSQQTFTRESAV